MKKSTLDYIPGLDDDKEMKAAISGNLFELYLRKLHY
jgi:hypothetical protein